MNKYKMSDWLKIDDTFTLYGYIWKVICVRDEYVIAFNNIETRKFTEDSFNG